jgi:sodium transport system permease protein
LRDRRTLLVVLLSSVLMGPLVLVMLSALVGNLEQRAERRELVVAGLEHGPTLVNYLQRQGFSVRAAPADYEAQLRRAALGDPVLVLPADFEAALQRGEAPAVEVVSDSANKRSEAGSARLQRLLAGFGRERAMLALALRGVAPELTQPLRVHERDLADPRVRGTQITGMLPFFVLIAVLYGALHAALDSTAGERERGSLEPLLTNPAPPWALVLGKWGAVVAVAMAIALLACFSFIPAQWLLRSDTLAALFQFGVREALAFLAVLAPFAAALSALLMAVAIRCRSVKEAQASAGVVVLVVSLLPLAGVFNLGEEAPWQIWVPALAQNTLMTRVLRGEPFGPEQWLIPPLVCAALAAAALTFVAARLRQAAVR